MDTASGDARCAARKSLVAPALPSLRSRSRSIQKVVSVSIAPFALALAHAFQRFEIYIERALQVLEVLFQVAKGTNRWRHKTLHDVAETFILPFMFRQGRVCVVTQHHIFAHT